MEVLSTTPPYIIHRTIHLKDSKFTSFKTFKNVTPGCRDADQCSADLKFEADTLRALKQPSVPGFFDYGAVQGHGYLISKFIWGKSLLHILRELQAHRRMLSVDYAVHIAVEICRCLAQAHATRTSLHPDGVVHYNLNPRNIIVSYSGQVHLVDFGHRSPRLSRETWNQFEFRNLTYLSPEQVTNAPLSSGSDLFSVGSILYEMLTGTPPFLEKTPEKVVNRIARCSFQAPQTVNPGVPRELDKLLLRTMSAYPGDRFASAAELSDELERFFRKQHPGFTSEKLRKLMKSLFEKDIVGDIRFFGKLAETVDPAARMLIRSIPRILFDEVSVDGKGPGSGFEGLDSYLFSSGTGARSRSAGQPRSVDHQRPDGTRKSPSRPQPAMAVPEEPDEMDVVEGQSTVNCTLEEFQKQKHVLRRSDSFFEAEDTVLVGGPGAARIVPIQVCGEVKAAPAPAPAANIAPAPAANIAPAPAAPRAQHKGRTSVQEFGDAKGRGGEKSPPQVPVAWESTLEPDPRILQPPAEADPPPVGGGVVPSRDDRAQLIGKQLGEYTITGILGWGGMGTVYDGLQPTIGKEVAIKVLNPTLCANPNMAKRFLAEAKAVNSIRNPNIIDIFSFGKFEDHYLYFVMEKLHGITLGSFIQQQRITPMNAAHEILAQVFSAVSAAHEKGIIHRDLKPENIYLEKRPLFEHYVKILDFGIAKFTVDGYKTAITKAGTPIGTPRYMSPEQCSGHTVTAASDIYSLGVILYEMFTGTLPFRKNSYLEMLLAHLNETPTRPSMLVPMDMVLENIILWALRKDPKDRPASVRDLSDNLLAYLQTKRKR
ncbi:serine/threonine protein kinase [Myxococcota bacterium]|nr:serine/threonine protein kinase [Myxococcota bacterium]